MNQKTISEIASDIYENWKDVNYAAKPYLQAMLTLKTIEDDYGSDSGRSIVAYFLSNARSWKGAVAKENKSTLEQIVEN